MVESFDKQNKNIGEYNPSQSKKIKSFLKRDQLSYMERPS